MCTTTNTGIISLDNNCVVTGLKNGSASVHVLSNYDGYENDIAIVVDGDTYKIAFDSNGGTGTMDEVLVTYDEYYTLPLNTFIKEGNTFAGWSTEANGTVVYKDTAVVKNLANKDETITLYAVWQKAPYIIHDYVVSDETLSGIPENTTIEEYKSKFELAEGYSIEVYVSGCGGFGYCMDDSRLIGTGSTTIISYGDQPIAYYINIVKGDVTGDGMVNIADVIKLADHTVTNDILDYFEELAAEVTHDTTLNIADVIKLADYTVDRNIEL